MPRVSVIIPTYNYGRYIEKAIDSVLAQTYQDFEIIVVDDGSTDNTRTIIVTKYRDKVKYIYQENKGASAARNQGLREASGDFIVFLDADDWFAPENLEYKTNILENDADVGWVYSDWYYVDEKGHLVDKASDRFSFNTRQLEGDISSELFSTGNYITMDSVLMRKTCIDKVGVFDESLPALQDYDLWLRIALSFPVKFINIQLSYSLIHLDSITFQKGVYPSAFLMIARKYENIFMKKLGKVKWRRIKADKYNYYGLYLLKSYMRKQATKAFLQSICSFPFQREVYKYLLSSLLQRN